MNPLLVIIIVLGVINGVYYGLKVSTEIFLYAGLMLFAVIVIRSVIRSYKDYRSMPTVEEYKNKYAIKGGGLACSHCGSRSIRNWGRLNANDSERVFICNHCGSHLYRN